MNDIMSIVQALENSNILLKVITKTIETETKEQKGGLLEKKCWELVMKIKKEKEYWELAMDLKNFNSSQSFNKDWNMEVLSESI